MTTQLGSIKSALMYALSIMRLDPKETSFESIPSLKISTVGSGLLDDPETSDTLKEMIRTQISAQKGFKIHNPKITCNIQLVIEPFREGYGCWVLIGNGYARRL